MMSWRKPELIPSLACLLALALFVTLGNWQMSRLHWKRQVMAEASAAQTGPALGSLPQDVSGLTYHKVALTGTFLFDKTIHLIGRQQGQSVGYYMVTPFALDDDGRIILVNRGFAPLGQETKPLGPVTVEGILRPLREHRYFAPKNNPEKNIWSYEDADELAQFIGTKPLPLVVEVVGKAEADVFPIPNDGKVIFRNDHLGYAITWYGLAVVSIIMFAAYYRKKP